MIFQVISDFIKPLWPDRNCLQLDQIPHQFEL